MKKLLLALLVGALLAGCGGQEATEKEVVEVEQTNKDRAERKTAPVDQIDLDDPEIRAKIINEAIDAEKLEWRGKQDEELFYAPNQQTPYSGWAKGMYDNGRIAQLGYCKDGKLWTAFGWKPNGDKCPVTRVVNGNGGLVEYDEEDGMETDHITYKDGEQVD